MAKQSTKKKLKVKKPVPKKKLTPSKPARKAAVKKKAVAVKTKAVAVKAKVKAKAAPRKVDVVKAKKLTPLAKKTVREEKVMIQLPACYPEPIRKKITLIPGKILTADGWLKLFQED